MLATIDPEAAPAPGEFEIPVCYGGEYGEDLEALAASVRRLRDIVEAVSRERLEELRRAAGQDGGPSG